MKFEISVKFSESYIVDIMYNNFKMFIEFLDQLQSGMRITCVMVNEMDVLPIQDIPELSKTLATLSPIESFDIMVYLVYKSRWENCRLT